MKIARDPVDILKYLADESRMPGGQADEVLWPETPEEAAQALAQATSTGGAVTVSGAGTGTVGGRVPLGGAVLATDRLSRIVDLQLDRDARRGRMRVQAGVTLAAVQQAAAAEGFWYPPDPTENGCFIGGNLATNASGARSHLFGATRRWVTRCVVALADGGLLDLQRGAVVANHGVFEIPRAGGPLRVPAPDWSLPGTRKHAAGYFSAPGMDLLDLFVGSEGTLGAILEADLILVAAPGAMLSGILFFDGEAQALALVAAARGAAAAGHGVSPAALEFFDGATLALLREKSIPVPAGARAAIFFEQPGERAEDADALLEAWVALAESQGAANDSWLSQEAAEQEKFREFRHLVPTAINEKLARRGVRKVSTDTAVPEGRAGALLAAYRKLLDEAGLESVAFGHVGDDHLHVNILPAGPEQLEAAKSLYARLVRTAVEMGGTVSAEHGLGKLKRQDLCLLYPPVVIDRMRAIKNALDPRGVLGRGVLLPD